MKQKKKPCQEFVYSELIGALQFLANVTRFDIAFSVNMLSRYLQDPGPAHWNAAKRVLRYLKETINEGISYKNITSQRESFAFVIQMQILQEMWINVILHLDILL